jgi:hypothetical protein
MTNPFPFDAMLAILPALFLRRNGTRRLLSLLSILPFLLLASCGGGSAQQSNTHQPSAYTLTVTATGSGVLSTTQTLSLTIQ